MIKPPHDAHVGAWRGWLGRYIRARSRATEDGCWLWRGAINTSRGRDGVPVASVPGRRKTISVRRLAATVADAAPVRGQVVITACGDRDCVNPDHMQVVTRRELGFAMVADGRIEKGPTRSARKLAAARSARHVHMTIEKARAMRARFADVGVIKYVAREFGISLAHAHKIVRHQLWRERSPFDV